MLIGKFQKNALEELRVTIDSFKGNEIVNIRVYYQDDHGEFNPSKKGITFVAELEKCDELIKLLQSAKREILKREKAQAASTN
ncbi:hypothetical protein AMJ80_12420 [bacterium SM23_31]|nr:MAG: hypothetical protein AMJ80_12420 [bacterium SM23_31]